MTKWIAVVKVLNKQFPTLKEVRYTYGPYKRKWVANFMGYYKSIAPRGYQTSYWITEDIGLRSTQQTHNS
jgi:hypothetical protein